MNFRQMTLGTKLAAAFALLALLVVAVCAMALTMLGRERAGFEHYTNEVAVRLNMANAVLTRADERAIKTRDLLLASTPAERQAARLAVAQAHTGMAEALGRLKKLISRTDISAQERSLFAGMDSTEALYDPLVLSVAALAADGQREAALHKLNVQGRLMQASLAEGVRAYLEYGNAQAAAAERDADAAYALSRSLLLGACATAVALAVGLALTITPSITRQLGGEPAEAVRVAREIAQGNLGADVPCRGDDQHSLMAALKRLRDHLVRTVGEVRCNAEGVATASTQIAQGNQDLSRRTELQAATLQQTAGSMEELGSTVRHNADSASQADQLAKGASDVALKGGAVVAQVVDTMRGIEESSAKIADIINVINGITFQTNILALNAAVEAARAGEAGRGFAVVAGEVRTLAQRSAEAARQIKALITDSVRRVGEGSALADQAGRTMGEVVAAIQRVTDLMGEINAASAEQSAGVGQVGQAVTQMDQATQQNVALVEQSAAAAASLRLQAQRLVQAVSVFSVAPASGFATRAWATPAPLAAQAEPRQEPDPARGAARPQPARGRELASAVLVPLGLPRGAVGGASLGGA
jgi:methyl-accepting chemotaxis protein-1 (serine sensor receptor)